MKDFFKEIRRRKVWQIAVVYTVIAWVLLQVADTVLPIFETPDWVLKAFTILLALGFPVALVFAWIFDLTPAGIRRTEQLRDAESDTETGKESPTEVAAPSTNAQTGKSWVAVMPFRLADGSPELNDFAGGLTEDICAGLARFPYLAVIAQKSIARQAEEIADVREFSQKLGARYVIEGSVRQSGNVVRVSVRLIEGTSGVSLWAENFTRDIADTDLFPVQDEITDHVVATIADSFGVLVTSMIAQITDKPETELTPNDWVLRTFEYLRHYLPAMHKTMRSGLEEAVIQYPRNAEIRACLAQLYLNEYNFGFNPRPDPLDRALKAAEQAFELDGASQMANQQLAQVYFFRRDLVRFRAAANRAIALNSLDTNTLGILGLLFVHIQDFEHGVELTQRAMDLNQNHAHWCHFSRIWYHYARGEFERALEAVSRVNISGNFWIPLATTAICSELGRTADAQAALAQLLAIDPDIAKNARFNIECWHFSSGLKESLIGGLKDAGLEVV